MKIIYEDEAIIVVVKPPGLLSQGDQVGTENLYDQLKKHLKCTTLGMIQRLDRPVGGLMVFGKSELGNKGLMDQMQQRTISKVYLAVVEGEAQNHMRYKNYLQKVRGNRAIVSNKPTTGSKEAILTYEKLQGPMSTNGHVLLKVTLETGRFHQIRAQLAHHKLPIVGDTKYNLNLKETKEWHNLGLYAYSLSFKHPITQEVLRFENRPTEAPFDEFDLSGLDY